ncbi:MAG: RDD family protein [Bacteroidota bacterium]
MAYDERILDADYNYTTEQRTAAPKYKRFLNFFIDYFIGGSLLGIIVGALIGLLLSLTNQQAILDFYLSSMICKFLLTLSIIIGYYTICEYYFEGKTIGKLITQTRVVSCDGKPLLFRQVLLRSIARFLPFETISVLLGQQSKGGWHDQISKTMVVEEQKNKESRTHPKFLVKELA